MILIIDNYDSFTWNLYQLLRELTGCGPGAEEVRVVRNDRISLEEIEALAPRALVLSPGPGRPEEAGICLPAIRRFAGRIPILGVCLGHQAIGAAYGARIVAARRIVHGKTEQINLDGRGLFRAIPLPATVTRYHSLVVDPATLPEELEITATSPDGEIMGLRHREHPVEGVQFHPESVGTPFGRKLLANFLQYRREPFPAAQLLSRILSRVDLSFLEMEQFMEELTEGNLNGSQVAGFLVGLNAKGFTPREIAGAASVLRRKKTPFRAAGRATGPPLDNSAAAGYLRHRRGRHRHLQHLLPRRRGRGGLRRPRRQARQPGGELQQRQRGLLRRPRPAHRPPAGRPPPACWPPPGSPSCTPRCTTRPCATPPRCAASWA